MFSGGYTNETLALNGLDVYLEKTLNYLILFLDLTSRQF